MTNQVDTNGRKVLTFEGQIQNLSRLGELTDAVTDMAESGAWRKYQLATGTEIWRPAEFDYFLIAQGMQNEDVRRVLAYNKRAKLLAPLMDSQADRRRRRTLGQAAAEWHRLNIDLVDRARELGWIPGDRDEITPTDQPIPEWTQRTYSEKKRNKKGQQWSVRWNDNRSRGEAIADKLLKDDVLARDVYNRLEAERVRTRRENKRRSIG